MAKHDNNTDQESDSGLSDSMSEKEIGFLYERACPSSSRTLGSRSQSKQPKIKIEPSLEEDLSSPNEDENEDENEMPWRPLEGKRVSGRRIGVMTVSKQRVDSEGDGEMLSKDVGGDEEESGHRERKTRARSEFAAEAAKTQTPTKTNSTRANSTPTKTPIRPKDKVTMKPEPEASSDEEDHDADAQEPTTYLNPKAITPPKKTATGPTMLQITIKISKLAENSFDVAEAWEGFLDRHMKKETNSIKKVQEALDGIAGKRKAVSEDGKDRGKDGRGRKKVNRGM
ncbi:hypothetical protein EJ02DRAFT_450582 [Clathrospora elynae]|uniref:Uncharacterized protein n=1 Tax=Clathrospora elynae TaxID=706981 RepID=A0A6A5T1I6_9PLEO|nr:hypothetical protein EJ02DRAFT_450582 [Clathrospora elynae]